ncbi:MAG: PilZ domain-containing protein [Candidatus Adiutrix sp.]|nr:PilZ domain-containing protein [Candidatus Adiutrix sp.]
MLEVDNLTGQADIRSSMILDLPSDRLIIVQPNPPLGKSNQGRKLEASVVHYDLVTHEITRWGWTATILELDDKYKLHHDDPSSAQLVSVIVLGRPGQSSLSKSNVRQAYRLDPGRNSGIAVAVNPEPAPVSLLNFSAGGLMLKTSTPSPYTLGQELSFELAFPDEEELPVRHLKGQALVVRLELNPDGKTASLGLKFQALGHEAQLALPKVLQHYMLEEQRHRHQDDDL